MILFIDNIISAVFFTGGSFGLWTGISLFTFVEFIYFAGINLKYIILEKSRRKESDVSGNSLNKHGAENDSFRFQY